MPGVKEVPGVSEHYGKLIQFKPLDGGQIMDIPYGGDVRGTGKKQLDRDTLIFNISKWAFPLLGLTFIGLLIAASVTGERDQIISTIAFGGGTAVSGYFLAKKWKKIPNNVLSTYWKYGSYNPTTGSRYTISSYYPTASSLKDLSNDLPLIIKGAKLSYLACDYLARTYNTHLIDNRQKIENQRNGAIAVRQAIQKKPDSSPVSNVDLDKFTALTTEIAGYTQQLSTTEALGETWVAIFDSARNTETAARQTFEPNPNVFDKGSNPDLNHMMA